VLFVGSISPLQLVTVASQFGGYLAVEQLEFEVASVGPSQPPADPWYTKGTYIDISRGTLTAQSVTLRQLLEIAYRTQESRIVDGPSWLSSDRFDVIAKGRSDATEAQVSLMLQRLLGERFKVRLHGETRDLPVYTLEIAKGGSKLSPAATLRLASGRGFVTVRHDGDCTVAEPLMSKSADGELISSAALKCGDRSVIGDSKRGSIFGRATPVDAIARALSGYVERPVSDKTGLTGLFDFALSWSEPSKTRGASQSSEFEANSLFTAVQDRLGLRLVSRKGPVEVFVIDQAEQPTSN
jgi:uncharacterized protein (TIGR03435 family)